MSLALTDLELLVQQHTTHTVEYTKKFYSHIKTIINMTRESCGKKLHVILKCLEEDSLMLWVNSSDENRHVLIFEISSDPSSGSLYEQRVRKESLRKELEQLHRDLR